MKSACGHLSTSGHPSPPLPTIGASWLALEPRIMFDGAAPATVDSVAAAQLAQSQAESSVSPDDVTTSDTPPAAPTGEPQFNSSDQALFDALAAYDTSAARQEILFLSPSVRDYQKLLDGISPNVEVFILDPTRDGVEQMAETLANRTGIDAIHIISHGTQAELTLGTARLTLESMNGAYADELAVVGRSLTEHADLMIYGCNFGQGDQGAEAASRLAQLTGADVAASTDDTGHASLGGDWDLEYTVGPLETSQLFTTDVQQNWSHLMATETVLDNFSSVSYSNNNGTQSWSTNWVETDNGGGGSGGGNIRVTGGQLYIDMGLGTVGNDVYREVNLTGALSATLSYSYTSSLGVGGALRVRISDDGGSNYTTLISHTNLLPASGTQNFDITSYISANMRLLFEVTGALLLNTIQFDNVGISYVTNDPPVITNLSGDSLSYSEGAGAVVIEQGGNATVSDVDSADFNTGTLTVSFTAGSDSAEDVLAIRNQGAGAGQIGVSGSSVTYQGTTIGTFTGGSGGANLVITLNSNATPTAVTALVKNITYENTDTAAPTTGARTVRYVVTDGDGGSSGNHDATVTVSGVNDAPTITALADQTIPEDGTTGALPFSVSDVETAAGSLTVTAASSNPTLIPNGNLTLVNLGGGNWTIAAVPAANQNGGPVTLTVTVSDGTTTTNETFDVTVTAVNDAPVNSVSVAQSTNEDTTLVFSSGNGNPISLSDSDAGGGTMQVTLTAANGTLTLSGTAGLTFTTGDGTADGTMTFTGTMADINQALNGLGFTPNFNYNGPASVQLTTDDQGNTGGGALSDTDTVAITVGANNPPVVTPSGGSLSYTENDGAVAIDTGVTVSDADNPNLVTARVRITGNYVNGQDLLAFTDQLGITGSWNAAAGELTLTGSAPPADYQTALLSITYTNLSEAPDTALRTVSFVVNDGIADSAIVTRTITVAAVNDPPVNSVPGAQSTNEDTALIFSAANGNQISISNVDAGAGVLQVALTAINGTLTLSGTAGLTFTTGDGTADATMTFTGTAADADTALNGLSFLPTANFNGTASVQIQTDDQGNSGSGGAQSDQDSVIVTVNPIPDTPSVTNASTNEDQQTTSGLVLSRHASDGTEVTHFKITGISGGTLYQNDGTTVITDGAFITVAQGNAGLKFTPSANSTNNGAFTLQASGSASDAGLGGDLVTAAITVTAVNDDPFNAGTLPTDVTVTEDALSNVDLSAIDLSDVDAAAGNLTVTLATATGGNLTATSGGGVTVGGSGSGTLTLTGTLVDVNQYLNDAANVQYLHGTADINGNNVDTITVQVTDNGNTGSGGGGTITLGTVNVDITPVNDAPTITALADQTISEDGTTGALPFSVSDVETAVGSLTVTAASSNPTLIPNGNLTLVNLGGGNWTIAAVPAANQNGGPVTLTVTVSDGTTTTNETFDVTVAAVNDAPVVAGAGGTLAYSEGAGPQVIDSSLTITNVDDSNIESATISITGGLVSGEDVLAFTNTGAITGSYNAGTGVLTLTGTDTLANYEAALESLTYENTNTNNPNTGTRTVTWVVNDGSANSTGVTSTVTVSGVNDAPVVGTNAGSTALEGGLDAIIDGEMLVTDPDNVPAELVYTVTPTPGNGQLELSTAPGVAVTSFTQADIDAGLLRYVHNGSETTADSFIFTVSDGDGGTIGATTFAITVNPVNDAPTITNLSGDSLAYAEGDGAVVIEQGGNAVVSDVDSANFDTGTLTVTFTAGSDSAEDVLAIRNQGTGAGQIGVSGSNVTYGGVTIGTFTGGSSGTNLVITFNSSATPTAVTALVQNITYENTDTNAPTTGARTVRYVVTDGDGGTSANSDTTVTVSGVNNAPAIADATVSLDENSANGTAVTNVSDSFTGTDVDRDGQALTYSITAGNTGGAFAINAATGALTVATSAALDFETTPSFTLTVQASDGTLTDTAALTVTLNNLNESPVNSAPSLSINAGSTIIQGLTDVITLGELHVTDADNSPGQLTYTIIAAPLNGRLELTTAPGVAITTFTQADIDAGRLVFVHSGAVATSDSFAFTVSDGAGGTIGATTFTFTVAPFIPPPSGGGGSGGIGGGSTGGSGTGSGPGSGSSNSAVLTLPIQSPSVLISTEVPVEDVFVKDLSAKDVSVVGATNELLPRAVIANPTFPGIEQPDTAIQKSEPRSLPVKNVLAVGHTLAERLVRLADDLDRGVQERGHQTHLVGRLASLFGMALSAGFAAWILRGGSLVASFLGSMPAWRHFDPLPVLEMGERDGRRRDRKMHEEAEGEKMLLPANPNSERRGS